MEMYDIAVVGGGAAGITAAIAAARKGAAVALCEKMPQLGKKILASGNGRCNLLNDDLSEQHYNPAAQGLVKSVFSKFGRAEISDFFQGLGLKTYSEKGRVFPVTNQSSSVLKSLKMEVRRLPVTVELGFEAADISCPKKNFIVKSRSGKIIESSSLIIACGGRTYPALGSSGSSYTLADIFGHKIIDLVPSAVPIVINDRLCHVLQGQKIFAKARSIIDGKVTCEAAGDVLFTKYGLSGSAILDVSRDISIAINRNKKRDVAVSIDMVPFLSAEELRMELDGKYKRKLAAEDMLTGILPNKFGAAFKELLNKRDMQHAADMLKGKRFEVAGTRGWNEAEFTSGGVDTGEVKEGTLESKLKKGLYFAGEALDVDGARGGYNLAWAWSSGFTSGSRE